MDKNFLFAFLLSTVAIFLYYTLFPPQEKPVEQQVKTESAVIEQATEKDQSAIQTITTSESDTSSVSASAEIGRKEITIENEYYTAKIDTKGGVLTSFLLKKYKYQSEPHFNIKNWAVSLFTGKTYKVETYNPDRQINMIGDLSDQNRVWQVSTGNNEPAVNYQSSNKSLNIAWNPEILSLRAMLPSGIEVTKNITFYPQSYLIDMEISMSNRTDSAIKLAPRFNFGAGNEAIEGELFPKPKLGIAFTEDEFEKYDDDDFETPLAVKQSAWTGVMDTYFISVAKLHNPGVFSSEISSLKSVLNGDEINIPKVELVDDPVLLGSNQAYKRKLQLFMGPKVQAELEKFDFHLPQAMDLGWFEFLAHPLLAVLRWLQSYVVNWGIAIILLTLIVRSAMFPLAFTGMRSMRKMSQLNPKIKSIREKYKNNKERMNKEIMQFYRQHKINPMGGCLPMALQIPIFIALYQALMPAIELRHTPFFFWLNDLSSADFTLILPILMGVSMFVQQTLTPTPAMDPTQQKIMKWMPVMMVLFFLSMPSGLVLYWVISNLFTIGQQLIFNKVSPAPPIELETKKASGKQSKSGKRKKK